MTDRSRDGQRDASTVHSEGGGGVGRKRTVGTDSDTQPAEGERGSVGRRLARLAGDYLFDLLILTGWTVGLTLLFLSTGWPRWGFYGALLVGAVAFTQLSARAGRRRSGADEKPTEERRDS